LESKERCGLCLRKGKERRNKNNNTQGSRQIHEEEMEMKKETFFLFFMICNLMFFDTGLEG
jgi:hypothetical protein